MMLLFALQLVLLVISIALVMRVWRASALDGVLCLIVPFYVFVPLIKHWKDPQHDVRFHVLLLMIAGIGSVWLQYHPETALIKEQQRAEAKVNQQAQTLHDYVYAGTQEDDEPAPDDGASVDLGRAGLGHSSNAPIEPAAAAATAPVAPINYSSDLPRAPSAVLTTFTLAQAVKAATYQRGTFDRSTIGFMIDIPEHFHLLSGNDVRRIEHAAQQPLDRHEVAWMVHESVALDAPAAWHVRVRWLSDGWVAVNGSLDASRLLLDAQRGSASKLAGSRGELIGFAVAPSYSGGVADWVEERLPAHASASVLDCHALRLGRRGVVEFSVVAAPPGSQALCDASVRLLARSTRFEPGAEYSPAGVGAAHAPYTLEDLVAGTR
jgi:hypothetical protein